MHGQALALKPYGGRSARLVEAPEALSYGDRSARLVEEPKALSYGDDQFDESALGINPHALRLMMPRGNALALAIPLLALACGAASIWLTKAVYSARATIQIDPQRSRILGTEKTASAAGQSDNDRVLQTQVDLLASRSTAQNVARKLNLANNPLFLREAGLENEPAGPKRSAKVTDALQDRLSLSSPGDTNIVAVRFDSHDPMAAARTANTFAETFISDSLKRRRVSYDYARRFLYGQVEVTTARLEQSKRNLANYAGSAGLVAANLEVADFAGRGVEFPSTTAASVVELSAAYSRAEANWMQAQQRWQRWQRAISAQKMSNPVAIITRAQAPALPAYPRPAMNMALAALVGALALGAGIARSRTKKEVDEPDDIERDFGAQLLGIVPLPKDRDEFARALSDPLWPGTEAHYAIFLALDRLARMADDRVLLLTSSCPNEGTSMIAFKLSANFAAAGKKVLVIETDMRRGSLHRMLGLSNQLGLSDLLARDSTYELTKVAQYCADRGFSVVPRGQSATNPAELLASRRFADLLDEAANLFDVVIMDGPPVLGGADAPRLSGMADATVFVLQANRTLPEQGKLAMRRLSEAGAEQIGLVITECEAAKAFGASDYAYSYDHAAIEAEGLAPQKPSPAQPAAAPRQPIDQQGQQPGPALPSPWASWLLAQSREGTRNAR